MSSVLRIRTSIEGKRTLPPVRTRTMSATAPHRPKTACKSINDLSALKLKISEAELKTRQLKAKTVRIHQEIHDRKAAVSRVLSSNNSSKNIETASGSTLENLNKNVNELKNTYESRREELSQIVRDDSLYLSQELEYELQMYYLELKRMESKLSAAEKCKNIIRKQVGLRKRDVESYEETQMDIDELEELIDANLDKYMAYQKGEPKIWRYEIASSLESNQKNKELIEQQLNNELNDINNDIEKLKQDMTKLDEQDQNCMNELQTIIEDQTAKIVKAVEESNNKRNRK